MSKYFRQFDRSMKTLFQEQRFDDAIELSSGALTCPELLNDALLWLGLIGVQSGRTALARSSLTCLSLRHEGTLSLQLLTKCLPIDAACAAAAEAYRTDPTDFSSFYQYIHHLACYETESKISTLQQLLNWHLPEIRSLSQQKKLLTLPSKIFKKQLGAIWKDSDLLSGWVAVQGTGKNASPELELQIGKTVNWFQPSKLQSSNDTWSIWHFSLSLQSFKASNQDVSVCFKDQKNNILAGSPILCSRALTRLSIPCDSKKKKQNKNILRKIKKEHHHVDILIPVYKGYRSTVDCINSVLESQSKNQTTFNILVINDASPEATLINELQQLANNKQIELHHQTNNRGFIETVNYGLSLYDRDIVLLNSDTLVHGNWLDRLRQIAYEAPKIASVTPLSNNGELMSIIAPCDPAPALLPNQLSILDQAAAIANKQESSVTINTGCGFCLYMTRAALIEIGGLDPTLNRGYGEDSDWCYRATSLGWHHKGALNLIVAHQGGASFGDEKRLRVKQNLKIIEQRYPKSSTSFRSFVQQDPMQSGRFRLIRQWLRLRFQQNLSQAPKTTLRVCISIAQAKRLINNEEINKKTALVYQGYYRAILIGSEPHLWRIDYNLPDQEAELRQDLQLLSLHQAICDNSALLRQTKRHLPMLSTKLARCNITSLLPDTHSITPRPMSWTVWRASKPRELIIAVSGELSHLNTTALLDLANRLAATKSPIYLIPLSIPASHSTSLWASGHVFPIPFQHKETNERLVLFTQHIPINGVLLLDNLVVTLETASTLDKGQTKLPWLHTYDLEIPALSMQNRETIQLEKLLELVQHIPPKNQLKQ